MGITITKVDKLDEKTCEWVDVITSKRTPLLQSPIKRKVEMKPKIDYSMGFRDISMQAHKDSLGIAVKQAELVILTEVKQKVKSQDWGWLDIEDWLNIEIKKRKKKKC